nr:tRNA (5-methylaminomethyl-2-thiouridine)(34)-methyltransferase MnmD [Sneathiella marina]
MTLTAKPPVPPTVTPPVSREFDDLYFSAENGLAESAFVFLAGNNLPHGWQQKSRFVIGETGFGTGLNFLAAWKLFDETAAPPHTLDFISFEKYPLRSEIIRPHLQPYSAGFDGRLQKLLDRYPPIIPGFHRLVLSERVTLTLIFEDVNAAIPKLDTAGDMAVDAWFLDGFKPATNPDMWHPALFAQMARLSRKGTRLSTYTAAGQVRRDLAAAGFTVQKAPGFGRKRHMTTGIYDGENP